MSPIQRIFATLIIPSSLVVAVCSYLWWRFDNSAPLVMIAFVPSILTFSYVFSSEKLKPEESLRGALVAALIVEYICLVSVVAFFSDGPDKMPAVTATLITSFTNVIGVVIASYFGFSAVSEGISAISKSKKNKKVNNRINVDDGE